MNLHRGGFSMADATAPRLPGRGAARTCGFMCLGRVELPTSRLSGEFVGVRNPTSCLYSVDRQRDLPGFPAPDVGLCRVQSTVEPTVSGARQLVRELRTAGASPHSNSAVHRQRARQGSLGTVATEIAITQDTRQRKAHVKKVPVLSTSRWGSHIVRVPAATSPPSAAHRDRPLTAPTPWLNPTREIGCGSLPRPDPTCSPNLIAGRT